MGHSARERLSTDELIELVLRNRPSPPPSKPWTSSRLRTARAGFRPLSQRALPCTMARRLTATWARARGWTSR
jgi:hypothetical protein